MYVEDVEDIKTSHNRCILKYVEDVEDRSNTHKGCNAMYVKDGWEKNIPWLTSLVLIVIWTKIDQIHISCGLRQR